MLQIKSSYLHAAMGCAIAFCSTATASVISFDSTVLPGEKLIDFNEVAIPAGTVLTSQFAQSGLTFSGTVRGNACSTGVYNNFVTMSGNKVYSTTQCSPTDGVLSQFSMKMSQDVSRLSMDLYAIDTGHDDKFELWNDGKLVADFSLFALGSNIATCTNFSCYDMAGRARGFLNIDGYVFDELRFRENGNDNSYIVMDNVRLTNSVSNNLPEPGSLALMGLGVLGGGLARRRYTVRHVATPS